MQGLMRPSSASRRGVQPKRRRRYVWVIILLMVVAVIYGVNRLKQTGGTTEIAVSILPCYAGQSVTPFRENVLYYDDASIHCVSGTGVIRWSFPVGAGASFSASDRHVIAWVGSQVYILDQNGRPTYNETMADTIQFCRIGGDYAAMVLGSNTKPSMVIKDVNGAQVDDESEAFNNLMMMDCGFYGEKGQYMWTLTMDIFGTAINHTLNTFQVGKMNTGEAALGKPLVYRILYENGRLRVFTTRQMTTYDFKAVQDVNGTMLVYGWKLLDAYIPVRGDASMLMAPTSQLTTTRNITELRLLTGNSDQRLTLPNACVGASVVDRTVYAYSPSYLYRANASDQRFVGYPINLPNGGQVTGFLGTTTGGRALVTSGDTVYSITMPQ